MTCRPESSTVIAVLSAYNTKQLPLGEFRLRAAQKACDPWNLIRVIPAEGSGRFQASHESPPSQAVFLFQETVMNITVNGEQRTAGDGTTIRQLLEELQIPQTRVAVEINLEIAPKATYGERTLQDGDRIEIVHFVGGG